MKTIELENTVQIFNHEVATAYAQLLNVVITCQTQTELAEKIEMIRQILTTHYHFAWGFGANHFWLKQRKERGSDELFENRILIVKF